MDRKSKYTKILTTILIIFIMLIILSSFILSESKYIITFEQDGENLYELTDAGRQALELVSDIIPGIAKFRVDNSFKETLGEFQNKASITSDFIPHNENEYSVKCKIVENNQTLFEVQVYAGTREQAKKIADNWNNNAEEIYPQILEILAKN